MKRSVSSQDSKQKNNRTDTNMDRYWSALKKEDHLDSFYKTELWLKNSSGSFSKPKNKIGIMKQYILTHKAKFALIVLTVLLLAACNMPVTQNETLGHVISWSVENPDAGDKTTSLPWVDKNSLSINENENGDSKVISYNLVLSNSTLEQVQSYSRELEAIPGVVTVNIMPLTEEVERPLYSIMLDGVFKIDINAKNMSDEELSAEVERQLKEGGIDVQTINFKRDENNRRLIDIKMSEDSRKNNNGFHLHIDDGNQKMVIQERNKVSDQPGELDFKGLNDNEIRQKIKEMHKDLELQDGDIHITRNGDEVSVNINKKNPDGKEEVNMQLQLKNK